MDVASSARYARQRILTGFGVEGQRRLADARVVVVGAGGLGSAILPALAAAGVGTVVVVDSDRVDESNLHRQTVHGPSDVGRAKAESAADRLGQIAPDVQVLAVNEWFGAANAALIVSGADVLVDATDNAASRFAADDAATDAGIPLVWGSALAYAGQVGVVWNARGVDYRDLFAEPTGEGDTCEIVGVLPTVCTVIGGMMATEVLKLLVGVGAPLVGTVIDFDALTGTMRRLDFTRDPARIAGARPVVAPTELGGEDVDPYDVDPSDVMTLMGSSDPPVLLDVRPPAEAATGGLHGAVAMSLEDLPARLAELDPHRETVVYCRRGVRSAEAVDVLRSAGFSAVRQLRGGLDAWRAAVEAPRRETEA